MATLLEVRTDVRARLNEITARQWLDSQLNTWINEGMRDLARRTETIQSFSTAVAVIANTAEVTAPADMLRVHRVEYVPSGGGVVYPLQLTTYDELDQMWGIYPNTTGGIPVYVALWGFPPTVKMRLYPVPNQAGNLNIFYYRLPATASADGTTLEVMTGYEDLIALYCEYVARRKDRDPTWQEAKQMYEERVAEMVDTTRQWHDQAMTISIGNNAVPQWLYAFDGDY